MQSGKFRLTNEKASHLSTDLVSFSFGENWARYLSSVDESTIEHAKNNFGTFTQLSNLKGHTFLDMGCGSGLNSLVAHRLGAERILSVDIDPISIDCVRALRDRFARGADKWDIQQGSVLDSDFVVSLGRFSFVYSWGVLHHTGSMWQALNNITNSVEPGGKLHIALYNKHKNSARWLKVKRICNKWPRTAFPFFKMGYILSLYVRLLAQFQSPAKYIREFRESRGMNFWRDVDDWLRGLPYEYCKPDQVVGFLSECGFVLLRLRISESWGCNEFLFKSEGFYRGNM